MHRRKARPGQFERMNARRERTIWDLRGKMIEAAQNGGKSGFAIQMRLNRASDRTAFVALRECRPRPR